MNSARSSRPPSFSARLWQTLALIVVLAIVFGVYTHSERLIDQANERRHESFLLADELRQSSDDLTRMARTYVMTGNPVYKDYYQGILDVRDGKKPRPLDRHFSYWNIQSAAGVPVTAGNGYDAKSEHGGETIPLLDLIHRAGVTAEEFAKLKDAKTNSDLLAVTEFEAMKLADAAGSGFDPARAQANLMLYDAKYHEAKSAIMRPIHEYLVLMDQRTESAVEAAERQAIALRNLFIALVCATIFLLWRAYAAMRATLGSTVDELHAQILKIGGGDFADPIAVAPGLDNSVTGHLAATKRRLHDLEMERRAVEESLRDGEQRWKFALEGAGDGIWDWDIQRNKVHFSKRCKEMLGFAEDELGSNVDTWVLHLHPDDKPLVEAAVYAHLGGETSVYTSEHRLRCQNGEWKWILDRGMVVDRDEAGKPLRMIGTHSDIDARKADEADLRIAATAFQAQEGMIVTDAKARILRVNPAFTETTGYAAEEVIGETPRILKSGRHDEAFYKAMWATIGSTGRWQGEIWDRRKNGEVFPKWLTISAVKNADGMITHYIGSHVDISERKRAEAKINQLAFYDPLTGLPNRALLLERLKRAMTASTRSGCYGAVLFIDLDNFKLLNDTLGHDKGDLLLQQVGQRLAASVREDDSVARLGGDEFVVILEHLHAQQRHAAAETEAVGEKILSALNRSYQLGDIEYRSTPSIGATLFRGDLTSIDDLLKQADLAMYKSKAAGRNTLRFFDPAMEVAILARVALEVDLRKAIQQREFVLHYQPQIAGDGVVTGAEALVRWSHPQRGLVAPGEFISLAEETGLILQLGQWVLETACQQLAAWAARPELARLTLAVNVSPLQFRQADFVAQVLAVLDRTQIDPSKLKLELTEGLLVDNVQGVIEKMFALKARGVCFSLDDFGTGYSSLAYLKRMPLDQLKIDQSFVRDVLTDPNDAAIARSIVALAQSLGLSVIAEGVEDAAQRDFLAGLGCHAYQGYYFSKPLPLARFEQDLPAGLTFQPAEGILAAAG